MTSCRWRSCGLASLGSALALALVACGPEPAARPGAGEARDARFLRAERPVAGQYLVVLEDGADDVPRVAEAKARAHGGEALRVYRHALRGFAARLAPERARALSREAGVAWVEEDGLVTASAEEPAASWGLDRIDQRALPLDGAYVHGASGAGVTAYVIDTGVRATHREVAGRTLPGFDAVGGGTDDCNGHGTHVAATIGGATFGVARDALLVPVRVLDCRGQGSSSAVIAGVDWVTAHHAGPSVANMSLGGPGSPALDAAVQASIRAGVTYAVAAGNEGGDACAASPARVPEAITAGATSRDDAVAPFSNQGACVDLFAPGVDIVSASAASDTAEATLSGTSMASPHVAGVAALYLEAHPGATPAEVAQALAAGASHAVRGAAAGTPDALLYAGVAAAPPRDGQPPAVELTRPAAGEAIAGTVTLAATAADADGAIARVLFLVDGALAGTFAGGGAAALAWDSTSVTNGDHTFAAVAYDASGNSTRSAPVVAAVRNAYVLAVTLAGGGGGTVSGGGIACAPGAAGGCTVTTVAGATLTLAATPDARSRFAGWSGACSGAGPCQVTLDRARQVTATFEVETRRLTVVTSGGGAGSASGGPISCASGSTAGCASEVVLGTAVTLTAAPAPGSVFAGWGGPCAGTAPTCEVAMTQERWVYATFEPAVARLNVVTSGTGGGAVSGGAIACASGSLAGCSADVALGAIVTLTAAARPGSTFSGWGGPCTGTAPTCAVSMTGMKYLYATFDVAVARLNVVTSGAGGGTVTGGGITCANGSPAGCSADVPLGAVTLTAAARPGSTFAGWAGACTGTAPACTLALTGMKYVYATFDLPVARLTVVTRGSGAGTVTGAGVACASASSAGCAADVPLGATITLGATAGPGSAFAGWAGACTGTAPTCTVTMAAARYVFAAFDPGG